VHKVFVICDNEFPGDQDELADFFVRCGDAAEFVRREGPIADDATPEQLRSDLIGDATVTLVLNGREIHARRDADWELHASLLPAADGLPNGLLGCTIDRNAQKFDMPTRLRANVDSGYARFYRLPLSVAELQQWLDAAADRRSQTDLVVNDAERLQDDLAATPTWSPFLGDDGRARPR
jgi:hypothetical protein